MNHISMSIQPRTRRAICLVHREYESRCFFADVWSKCPTCMAERDARMKAEQDRREGEARQAALQKKIGRAGIPERFQSRTLEAFEAVTEEQRRALAFARDYAANFMDVMQTGSSALFLGRPGTGKTHLACGIGLQIMREQGRTAFFTTVLRAIRRVKDSWARSAAESESQAIEALIEPDLLILDEVGVQTGSEFEKQILFDVMNERYERRKPSLLLSNLTADEVTAYLGERVIDRIREDDGRIVRFTWDSHRGKS